MGVEVIKVEALRLSPEDRAYLARELLASLDAMSEADIERLWVDEAIRRDDEIDKGTSQTYPAEEVLARARARRLLPQKTAKYVDAPSNFEISFDIFRKRPITETVVFSCCINKHIVIKGL